MTKHEPESLRSPLWAMPYVVIVALIGDLVTSLGSGVVDVIGFALFGLAALAAEWIVIAAGVEYGLRRVRGN